MSMTSDPIRKYDVAVIGLGYIGLPTAAFFANAGLEVYGMDLNPSLVENVNHGTLPFNEPGLEALLSNVVATKRLRAGTELNRAQAYIIAVPTPIRPDKLADLSFVHNAADTIAPLLEGGELIVLESTCPPGLTEEIAQRILDARPDLTDNGTKASSVFFAHAPERVLPGKIMAEMQTNARIVGGVTEDATEMARDLYKTFCDGEILTTDSRTAEMAKLAENAFRDVNIAFANELSIVCDKLGIDIWELRFLANKHPRVDILQPGPGVGGHCIAIDPWFIVHSAPDSARLITTARHVNDDKPYYVLDKIAENVDKLETPHSNLCICIFGITFKPDIDDLRESPALQITERLAEQYPGAKIGVVEPNLHKLPKNLASKDNTFFTDFKTGLKAANIAVVLVDHTLFRENAQDLERHPNLIDTRGITNWCKSV